MKSFNQKLWIFLLKTLSAVRTNYSWCGTKATHLHEYVSWSSQPLLTFSLIYSWGIFKLFSCSHTERCCPDVTDESSPPIWRLPFTLNAVLRNPRNVQQEPEGQWSSFLQHQPSHKDLCRCPSILPCVICGQTQTWGAVTLSVPVREAPSKRPRASSEPAVQRQLNLSSPQSDESGSCPISLHYRKVLVLFCRVPVVLQGRCCLIHHQGTKGLVKVVKRGRGSFLPLSPTPLLLRSLKPRGKLTRICSNSYAEVLVFICLSVSEAALFSLNCSKQSLRPASWWKTFIFYFIEIKPYFNSSIIHSSGQSQTWTASVWKSSNQWASKYHLYHRAYRWSDTDTKNRNGVFVSELLP